MGGVVLFSNLMNTEEIVRASDLEDPTLPVVYLDFNGYKADPLYGYLDDMADAKMRDAIIPLTAEKDLTLSYKAYDANVRSVMYEITAPDTGEVVANAQIGNFKTDGEYMTADFSLSAAILMNREYPICFTLELADGRAVRYYANLVQRSVDLAADYVAFVKEFYETCLNKSGAMGLNTYLETDNTMVSDTYANVTLKASLDQITWGNLNPSLYRRAIPTIKEINNVTCTLTQDYMLQASNDNGEKELYRVHEYYRLRKDTSRMRVLDFKREAIEVFSPETQNVVAASSLSLGVSRSDLVFKSDSSSDNVAFVQDKSLWCLRNSSQKLVCVYSYHNDTADGDERTDHDDYGIKVIRVTAGGDIDFLVYGYQNSGQFEGRQGILVCRYLGDSACVEERLFIPDNRAPSYLEKDLEKLSYISPGGTGYFYINGTVYQTSRDKQMLETVVSQVHPDCLVSSANNSFAAWANDMDPKRSKALTVMNLDDGTKRTITAPNEAYLKAVGFINNDFVYGTAYQADLRQSVTGELLTYLASVNIIDGDGENVMTYEKPGILISDMTLKSGLIELQRVAKHEDGSYTAEATDNIMNNKQVSETDVVLKSSQTTRQGRIYTLVLPKTMSTMKPLITRAPLRAAGSGIETAYPVGNVAAPLYYVYGEGELKNVLTDPGQAVMTADALAGTALNGEGQYLYERGGKKSDNEIANDDILEPLTDGTLNINDLQVALGDSATVVNLSGCTLEQVLYEVSSGRPVLAHTSNGGTALIVGYNNYNTRLYNFETGEHYWYGINDSTAEFAGGGNVFVSIIEPQQTIKP